MLFDIDEPVSMWPCTKNDLRTHTVRALRAYSSRKTSEQSLLRAPEHATLIICVFKIEQINTGVFGGPFSYHSLNVEDG